MLKVGITGGIGSGKSTVTNMLIDKGFHIIDADIVSREVFILYPEIMSRIKDEFGCEFFDRNGDLNRKELGNYIFKSETRRKRLENIMIPFIKKEINQRIKMCERENLQLCFIDAPTLIESKLHTSMDVTILVWVSSDIQIQRVIYRGDLNLNETMDRMRAQMPIDEKKKYSDYIINNGGSVEDTMVQLELIITELERLNVKK
ncbi:dephospho-CoA kinase [Clostridium algoriphilum]|uniref:dephospho-CoA kinase n=1 Tax=Clostridium algoriphilum TaxID=198347 RepID=UPI001CF19773|nr:dephospho-CoA kinase [Clostridium algoriphilum]MCB2292508.1 dephospho-CoA kinase [Clostridium algoriphilum]